MMELPELKSPKSHGLQKIAAFLLVVAENMPHDKLPENIVINMEHNGATFTAEWEDGHVAVIFDNNKVCEASVRLYVGVQITSNLSLSDALDTSGIAQMTQLVYYELQPTEKYLG